MKNLNKFKILLNFILSKNLKFKSLNFGNYYYKKGLIFFY